MQLPFLVVYGGWLWPIVGIVVVAAVYWVVRRRRLRDDAASAGRSRDLAAAMRERRALANMPAPVAAAFVALAYVGVVWGIGTWLVPEESMDDAEPWRSRLVVAAATPMRGKALNHLEHEIAAFTRQPGALAARAELLRLAGEPCEDVARLFAAYSHHEDALAQASRCTPSVEVLETIVDSNLALAQFANAADALTRAVQLSKGTRSWQVDELAVLAMARRWDELASAVTRLKPDEDRSSQAEESLACIAHVARHRAGDAQALAKLRAGGPVCKLFAADATGELADLQALTVTPLDASDLATKLTADGPRLDGDLAAAYRRWLAESTGAQPATRPYALDAVVHEQLVVSGGSGPQGWSEVPADVDELRLLVLATHAPGEPSNLVAPKLRADARFDLVWFGVGGDGQVGMKVRAARALWPHRASNQETATALVALLYTSARAAARAGDHARANAELAAAFDLQRSLELSPYDLARAHEDASIATLVMVLGRGDHAGATTLRAEIARARIGEHRIYEGGHPALDPLIAAANGELRAIRQLAGLNIEPQARAIEQALAGDGRALARLTDDDLRNIDASLPFLVQRVKDPASLATIVRTAPSRYVTRPWSWFDRLAAHLHLASAARDRETAERLRARVTAYHDVLTSNDVALIVAVLEAID